MALPATVFSCTIVSPDKVIFEGEVERLMLPSRYGDLALLPEHTPLYSELIKGMIEIWQNGSEKSIEVEGGLIRARDNSAVVIVGFSEEKF